MRFPASVSFQVSFRLLPTHSGLVSNKGQGAVWSELNSGRLLASQRQFTNSLMFPSRQTINDFPHLKEHAIEFDWLDKYLGVPENNAPLELGLYDTQGDFELPNKKLFCPYPSYMQAPKEDHKQVSRTAHVVQIH
ncbi:hypothetical protein WJX82_000160 [Trebouxia sp. C0006]